MPKLEHSKVCRTGVTPNYLNIETSDCSLNASTSDQPLDLRFQLAPKAGGATDVLFQICLGDLPAIPGAIASAMPESVGTLSNCAAPTNEKILEQLVEARRVQADDKARATAITEKLEVVSEFVSKKYCEAPAGSDEQEAAVKAQLADVVNSLRQLS